VKSLRLLVMALLACLLMPAGLAAFELGAARESVAAALSVRRDVPNGDVDDPGVAAESLGDDEPDDDDVGDEAAAVPVFELAERPSRVTGAVFGYSPGLRAAFGVRGSLFRPPRVAS
jgi:hypothetical protein